MVFFLPKITLGFLILMQAMAAFGATERNEDAPGGLRPRGGRARGLRGGGAAAAPHVEESGGRGETPPAACDLEAAVPTGSASAAEAKTTAQQQPPVKVEDALQKGTDFYIQGSILEEDPEYQVIVDCNALSVDIENEMLPQKKH